MGILEEQEWLEDVITEEFSEITGISTGIESDTVVYYKNAVRLWERVCLKLQIRANFVSCLNTIEDYVHQFVSVLKERNIQREKFEADLTAFIFEKTGRLHDPREVLFNGLLPHSEDSVQYCREKMAYELKLGNTKNLIRNKYNYFKDSESFYEAKTVDEIVTVLFGRRYYLG